MAWCIMQNIGDDGSQIALVLDLDAHHLDLRLTNLRTPPCFYMSIAVVLFPNRPRSSGPRANSTLSIACSGIASAADADPDDPCTHVRLTRRLACSLEATARPTVHRPRPPPGRARYLRLRRYVRRDVRGDARGVRGYERGDDRGDEREARVDATEEMGRDIGDVV